MLSRRSNKKADSSVSDGRKRTKSECYVKSANALQVQDFSATPLPSTSKRRKEIFPPNTAYNIDIPKLMKSLRGKCLKVTLKKYKEW